MEGKQEEVVGQEAEQSSVGNKDEIGQEIIDAQKAQLQEEIDLFTNNLKELEKQKAHFVRLFDMDKELHQIALDNFGLIEPQHKYQTIPRYWELQKEKYKVQIDMDIKVGEGKLKEFAKQKEVFEEQLKSASDKMAELEE